MGLQLRTPVGRQINLLNKIKMNKFLAVVCLAAGAMAEAEADPYYAAYGYAGLPVAGAYGAGVYGAGVYGARAYGAYAGAGRYVANSAGVVHVAKREAEAEAEPYYA